MVDSIPVSPTSTFIVYFWKEWSSNGSYWRGWIKHVQSGQTAAFQDEISVLRFIHSFGISYDKNRQPGKIELPK